MWRFINRVGNLKTALGRDICDEFHEFDYTDHLQLGILARKVGASFIVSASNDYGFFAALKVSAELGLCGYDSNEAAETIHYKDKFKALLERLKIPTPKRIFSGTISELTGTWPDLRVTLSPQRNIYLSQLIKDRGKALWRLNGLAMSPSFQNRLVAFRGRMLALWRSTLLEHYTATPRSLRRPNH